MRTKHTRNENMKTKHRQKYNKNANSTQQIKYGKTKHKQKYWKVNTNKHIEHETQTKNEKYCKLNKK